MKTGLFFSLDGLDGCGKSTQCQRLADWLEKRGHTVTRCADPGGTQLGNEIRHLLLNSSHPRSFTAEALLFMASRAQLVAEVIGPALKNQQMVVCDRFLLSTVVYQGYGRHLQRDMLWNVGRLASSGIEPDLTIVLDLPVKEARARLARTAKKADRMESEKDDFFQRVRDGFLSEAGKQPERIRVVNANLCAETVHERIIKEVSRVLETDSGT